MVIDQFRAARCYSFSSPSEKQMALLPTLIRWWEWLTAPIVQEWKKRSRAKCDATEGSNGGAVGSAWDALLDMDKYNYNVEELDQCAVTMVVDLAKAFEKVQLKVVRACAMHFGFPQQILRVLFTCFQHQRMVLCEGCAGGPLQIITAILPGSTTR